MQHTIERDGIRYSGERRDEILEIEKDYRACDWSCWTQAVPFGIALIGGIYVIVKLAVIIHWQLDANLICKK
jgi:hypothetical protein